MHSEGVETKHIHAMFNRVDAERAEAIKKAASRFYRDDGGDMTPLDLADRLSNLAAQAEVISLAARGLAHDHFDDDSIQSLAQGASDLSEETHRLSDVASSLLTLAAKGVEAAATRPNGDGAGSKK